MAPKGYEIVKQGKDIDLEGKEVYLAQIPANFDIKKAVIKSETEVTFDGEQYFMMSSTPLSNCEILTASKDGSLQPSTTKLTGLLAFTKQVPKLKVDYEKEAQPKPLVQQKENLAMRHFPTGYGPEAYGIDTTTKPKKRTEEEAGIVASSKEAKAPKPDKKKHKKDKSEKPEKSDKSEKKKKKKSDKKSEKKSEKNSKD